MQTPLGLGRPPRCRPPGVGQTSLDADPPGLGRPPLDADPQGWADPPWMQTPQGWVDPPGCRPPSGLGRPPWMQTPWLDRPPPHTVNKRAVRILLECILVERVFSREK